MANYVSETDFLAYAEAVRTNKLPKDNAASRVCYEISVSRERLLKALRHLCRGKCTLTPVLDAIEAHPALKASERLEGPLKCDITGKSVPYPFRFTFANLEDEKTVVVRSDLVNFVYAVHIVMHLDLIVAKVVGQEGYLAQLWHGSKEILTAFSSNAHGTVSREQ